MNFQQYQQQVYCQVAPGNAVCPQLEGFIFKRRLGQGSYGEVVLVSPRADPSTDFAMKIVTKKCMKSNSLMQKLFETELRIMRELRHDNIMPMYEVFQDMENYYMLLRFCSEGDLDTYMERRSPQFLPEAEAIFFLKQIMNGFQELRKNKIMHRDFKFGNVMVDSGPQMVIGDFGMAVDKGSMADSIVGTPVTMAPEILKKRLGINPTAPYTNKADIWSIGTVFYKLLFGIYPFPAESHAEIMSLIEKGAGEDLHIPRAVSNVSKETEDLLKKLLTIDPTKRITWKNLFLHPVFEKFQNTIEDQEFILNQQLLRRDILSEEPPNGEEECQMALVTRFEKIHAEINEMELSSHFQKFHERYSHRRSIGQFLFQIVKNLLPKGLNLTHFTPHYPLIIILQVLLIRKAAILIRSTADSMKEKKNLFKLPLFEKYAESNAGKRMLENFEKDFITFECYTEILVSQAQAKFMDKAQKEWLLDVTKKTNLRMIKLNDWLSNYITKLVYLPGVDMEAIPAVKQIYLKINHQVRLAIHTEKAFRFHWNNTKFNWDTFYSYLKKVTNEEMISKIGEFSLYPLVDEV